MSAVVPALGLFWLIAVLLIHVAISNGLAHQDCGFSPDPYVTLPNGYVVGSMNTHDGYLRAPGAATDVPVSGPGYVRSLIDLQFSNGYFTGTLFDLKTSNIRHFVFDTRTQMVQFFDPPDSAGRALLPSSQESLDRWTAAHTSSITDADSYWKLYEQYRHDWPNYILAALIILGECGIVLWLRQVWTANRIKPLRPGLLQ